MGQSVELRLGREDPGHEPSLREFARLAAAKRLEPLGHRWAHTQGVAATASALSLLAAPEERDLVVAAGWLHDVGYCPDIAATGFHPLDGARYLLGLGYRRLAGLVAHHTAARYEARSRGLGAELAEFAQENSDVADLVTYADLTTGPLGVPVNPGQRLAEIAQRYGPDHVVTQALAEARPCLLATVGRVESRLTEAVLQGLRRQAAA